MDNSKASMVGMQIMMVGVSCEVFYNGKTHDGDGCPKETLCIMSMLHIMHTGSCADVGLSQAREPRLTICCVNGYLLEYSTELSGASSNALV